MKEMDERYGPLEWRLPEAHAIYWGALGLKKTKPKNPIEFHRLIYQSMQLAVTRGRITPDMASGKIVLGPNIDMSAKAHETYIESMKLDPQNFEQVRTAHKNFLRNLPYYFYLDGRITEAGRWFATLRGLYPDAVTEGMELEAYVVSKISEFAGETSQDRTTGILKGLVTRYYIDLALGEDERARIMLQLANKVRARYMSEIGKGQEKRIFLPEITDLLNSVRDELVGPQSGLRPEVKAMIRTRLGMPAETEAAAAGAVRVPAAIPQATPTNSVPTNTVPRKAQ
jgi:hypothetical protein